MSKHPIIHVELSTTDRAASGAFYRELFGWETRDYPEMSYMTFKPGEGVEGGFNPASEDYPAGTITVYVQTSDVTASLDQAVALGATLLVPRTEIPGVGWFGFFRDPSGNMVGLMDSFPPQS